MSHDPANPSDPETPELDTDGVLTPARSRSGAPTFGSAFDTSEVELLISGAFLFSLFQIFQVLRSSIEYFAVHFPDGEVYRLFFAYLLMADVGLMLGFAIHLALRGFWIGLLGLHSVYPEPIDYDGLKYGPLYTRHMKERWATIPQMIGNTDRVASLVFSFSMTFVLMGLYFAFVLGLFGVVWFVLGRTHPDMLEQLPSPLILIFAVLGIQVVSILVDKRFLDREAEDIPAFVRGLARFAFPFTDKALLGSLTGPIMSAFRSKLQTARFIGLLAVYMVLLMAAIFTALGAGSDPMSKHNYAIFAERGPQTLLGGYYADREGARGFRNPKPRIQSDVIEGPYVKLFLPYSPSFNKALLERCPDVVASLKGDPDDVRTEDGAIDEARISEDASRAVVCLAGHFRVSLNGRELTELDLIFDREPEKGRRGLTAYIPTADLPIGRNDLLVEEIDHPLDDDEEPERHHIPFWR